MRRVLFALFSLTGIMLLASPVVYSQGEFVERGRSAIALGAGFSFSRLGDYHQLALGASIKGAVDFSVAIGELTDQSGGSGSYTSITLTGWLYKEGHNAQLSLAAFVTGNYHGFDDGDRNVYGFGVEVNKRFRTRDPKIFFQPSASVYHTYRPTLYRNKDEYGVRSAVTMLLIPLDRLRGFATGGYGVQGGTGSAEISFGLVRLLDSKR